MKTIKLKYDRELYVYKEEVEIPLLHIADKSSDIENGLFTGKIPQWICKKRKRHVQFYQTHGDKSLVATLNRYGVLCSCSDKLYSLGCIEGLPQHLERDELQKELMKIYTVDSDRLGYIYK